MTRSAQAERLNEILRSGPKAIEMTLTDQRQAGEHQEDLTSDPVGVTYEDVAELDGLWAVPDGPDPIGRVLDRRRKRVLGGQPVARDQDPRGSSHGWPITVSAPRRS